METEKRERLKRQKDKAPVSVSMQMCMCFCMHAYFDTHTLARTQNHTGNLAENCCVTSVCLLFPLSLVSFSSFPTQPSFIFRVFRDERKQLLCTLSKSEWVDEREREVGRQRVILREVKESQRVDETLGVRQKG